jgi:hypothetical protein
MKQPDIWWQTPDDQTAVPPELVAQDGRPSDDLATEAPVSGEVA